MIVCERKDLANYKGLDSRLDEAIDWILTDEWRSLPEGQKLVQGREIYLNRFSYETAKLDAQEPYETHFDYVDIHLIRSGEEWLSAAPEQAQRRTVEKPEEDCVLSVGEASGKYHLTPETAAILFPGEAHRTKEAAAAPGKVEKAVCKVLWKK